MNCRNSAGTPSGGASSQEKGGRKKPRRVEILVDAPAPTPASPQNPKPKGRPKGAVGATKRAQAAERAQPVVLPRTPREPEYTLEDHMTMMLRHTRAMQEARRTAAWDKYRSWVVKGR